MTTVREFIAKSRWTFAKTMSSIPHEYTLRERCEKEEFEAMVLYVRKHGYPAKFGSRTYIYLDVDGFKYWTMGDPLDQTWVLNRARL
jgi:hypothetical protein